jgi:hypothetical protein
MDPSDHRLLAASRVANASQTKGPKKQIPPKDDEDDDDENEEHSSMDDEASIEKESGASGSRIKSAVGTKKSEKPSGSPRGKPKTATKRGSTGRPKTPKGKEESQKGKIERGKAINEIEERDDEKGDNGKNRGKKKEKTKNASEEAKKKKTFQPREQKIFCKEDFKTICENVPGMCVPLVGKGSVSKASPENFFPAIKRDGTALYVYKVYPTASSATTTRFADESKSAKTGKPGKRKGESSEDSEENSDETNGETLFPTNDEGEATYRMVSYNSLRAFFTGQKGNRFPESGRPEDNVFYYEDSTLGKVKFAYWTEVFVRGKNQAKSRMAEKKLARALVKSSKTKTMGDDDDGGENGGENESENEGENESENESKDAEGVPSDEDKRKAVSPKSRPVKPAKSAAIGKPSKKKPLAPGEEKKKKKREKSTVARKNKPVAEEEIGRISKKRPREESPASSNEKIGRKSKRPRKDEPAKKSKKKKTQ